MDGFSLFSSLYQSWCHNPISCFTLCLLCEAFEHAANLMTLFGDIEITVSLLIQTDKLVQLLESPIFTSLRLKLLEPDRYPHLYKCLFGILMLLPQSSAFATLRNRLNCLGSLASLPIFSPQPQQNPQSSTSVLLSPQLQKKKSVPEKLGDQQLIAPQKWADFLMQFKVIQGRHDRARRSSKSQFIQIFYCS